MILKSFLLMIPQSILTSQAVNVMKLLCFLSIGSIAIFYTIYDGSIWMNNFYFISDKLQVSILFLFLTLNKNKFISVVSEYLYYISLVRLLYTVIIAIDFVPEEELKYDCIALFLVTTIISIYEWNTRQL